MLLEYTHSLLLQPCIAPAVARAVLPIYVGAWPVTLDALASSLPSVDELLEGRSAAASPTGRSLSVGGGASGALGGGDGPTASAAAWQRYVLLLDMALLLLGTGVAELSAAALVGEFLSLFLL